MEPLILTTNWHLTCNGRMIMVGHIRRYQLQQAVGSGGWQRNSHARTLTDRTPSTNPLVSAKTQSCKLLTKTFGTPSFRLWTWFTTNPHRRLAELPGGGPGPETSYLTRRNVEPSLNIYGGNHSLSNPAITGRSVLSNLGQPQIIFHPPSITGGQIGSIFHINLTGFLHHWRHLQFFVW
jgi:hypothetical protein